MMERIKFAWKDWGRFLTVFILLTWAAFSNEPNIIQNILIYSFGVYIILCFVGGVIHVLVGKSNLNKLIDKIF